MLKGIDVSNWQQGLNLATLGVDFAIMKATEGVYFVDAYCDGWVQQAKANGILWGFYHFAKGDSSATAQADYFIDKTRGYFNEGIPVLDIEDSSIVNWGMFADEFTQRVYERTGVYPIIYCSAGFLGRFAGYECVDNCGLWVAGYPYAYKAYTDDELPYSVAPWKFAAIWQFTSSLRLTGYDGNLDGDIAYMDAKAWKAYAGVIEEGGKSKKDKAKPTEKAPEKSVQTVAFEVIQGKWGNGLGRKRELERNGYDYSEVQAYVNKLYKVANEVIRGDYGNGEERKERLRNKGFDYESVQYVVNLLLL